MRMCKLLTKEMTVEMLQFWPLLIFESRQVTGIFHGTKSFDVFPVATFTDPITILFQHSDIKSDIVSDDVVRFFYVVEKIIDITVDILIGLKHRFADTVHSLCKKIYVGRDIDILIDSHFFVKFFSIPNAIYSRKLNDLISRGEAGSFCIDEEQSDLPTGQAGSFVFFRRNFLSSRLLLNHRIL